MTVTALQTSNAGVFEYALAHAMGDDLPIPYREILDPYLTPAEFLPFLAKHYSVDLWFPDWPEARKREMIAQVSGQSTIYPGQHLAELKGTFEGLKRYLWFVDATVIARIAYPVRFRIEQSPCGITPIQHPPFKARYLIKVALAKPVNAFVAGQSALGISAVRPPSREPIDRAKLAARVAKSEHAEYIVTFTHRRKLRFGDAPLMDGTYRFASFIDRTSIP